MEHARHVFRVVFVLVVVIAGFSVMRVLALPPTYGMYGPYRYANVAEQASRNPVHGGADSCEPCHKVQFDARRNNPHKTVSCEVCHGPLAVHAAEGKKIAAAPVDPSWTLCARCHNKVVGRPVDFPQKDVQRHVTPNKLEGRVCLECHDPHTTSS